MEQFANDIQALEKTSINRAIQAIENKETATFFIGRATCPYCRKFATKLGHVVEKTGAHVFFVNSEETSELAELQSFRSQYEIPTVPGFLHTENGEVAVRCDSSMSEEEIQAFIETGN